MAVFILDMDKNGAIKGFLNVIMIMVGKVGFKSVEM